VDTAGAETRAALEALRDLAAGVFPLVLRERGLAEALEQHVAGRAAGRNAGPGPVGEATSGEEAVELGRPETPIPTIHGVGVPVRHFVWYTLSAGCGVELPGAVGDDA
jgi:hypothetical protein